MIGTASRGKDSSAKPPYLSHLKLREPPFSPEAKGHFYYDEPQRDQYLNMLLHLTQYSEELLLVVGAAGIGKTALLERYLGRAEAHWKVCRLDGATAADPGRLFMSIARCFALDPSRIPPEKLLGALRAHLGRFQQQMTPVLVVDNAHLLSDDALEIVVHLAGLAGSHGKLMRVTLFAEPMMTSRMAAARFASAAQPHAIDLRPLDERETANYLNHRLAAAGFSGTSPFNGKLIRRIHKASQGIPAAINREAHAALLELTGGAGKRSLRIPRAALVAVGALLGLASAAVLLQRPLRELLERAPEPPAEAVVAPAEPIAEAPPPQTAPVEAPVAPSTLVLRPTDERVVHIQSGDTIRITCAPPAPEAPPEHEPPPAVQPQPSPPAAEHAVAKAQAPVAPEGPVLNSVEPQQLPGNWQRQPLTLHGGNFSPKSRVIVRWAGRSTVLPPDRVKFVDPTRLEVQVSTGPRVRNWEVLVEDPQGHRSRPVPFIVEDTPPEPEPPTEAARPSPVAAAPTPSQPPAAPTGVLSDEWLLQRPAGHFAIQLLSAREPESITAAVRQHNPPEPVARFAILRGGNRMHVLVQGDYPTKEAAEQAMAQLPRGLRALGPWARSFASVHKELVLAAGARPPAAGTPP